MKILLWLLLVCFSGTAFPQSSSRFTITRSLVGGSGTMFSTSSRFQVAGTIAQPLAAVPGSTRFSIQGGFGVVPAPAVVVLPGSLQVTIAPSGAVSAGAAWQVDGGPSENSGVTVTNLSAGNYTVSFTPVFGWIAPSNQTVTITNGETTTVTGVYTLAVINLSGVILSGTNLVLYGINGQSGMTYYVLTSTNLTLPLSQWTPIATDVLTASGNFTITVTNTVTTGTRQRFYILQVVASNLGGITLSGANLVLNGIDGQSGRTYYVLTSTNLALPLSQWTPVATNVLSANGNFTITITNTVTTGTPQQFYILESQ